MKLRHTFESYMKFDNGVEVTVGAVHIDNETPYININAETDISDIYSVEKFEGFVKQCQLVLDKLDNVRMEDKL